jgi:hypothetical protein
MKIAKTLAISLAKRYDNSKITLPPGGGTGA